MSPSEAKPGEEAAPARHPLLGLPPATRRALAQALVAEAEAHLKRQGRQGQRQGLVGGAVSLLGVGGLTLAWPLATGLAAGPALAFGLAFLAVQGVTGRAWAQRQGKDAPEAEGLLPTLALAPWHAAQAALISLRPPRLSEAALLSAATAFTALRRPQAKALLISFLARGWPLAEVEEGVRLLEAVGWVEPGAEPYEGILRLSPKGSQLASTWALPPVAPRTRQEPKLPPAVLAAFQAFAQRQTGDMKAAALPLAGPSLPSLGQAPVAPEGPTRAAPAAAPTPWAAPAPPPAAPPPLAATPPPAAKPAPKAAPEAPGLPFPAPEKPKPPLGRPATPSMALPKAPRRPWPWVAVALSGAAAIALALFVPRWPWPSTQDGAAWAIASAPMPAGSTGVALQGDGHGMLLSLFEGSLFWSVPDRLDYKFPVKLQGLDTPSACHVGRSRIRFAAASPSGRFLWLEMGGPRGAEEACLVDLETKTVHHAPALGLGPPAAPAFVGWAAEGEPVVAEAPPPASEARWWRLRPFSHQASLLPTPSGEALLPTAGPDGLLRVLALDPSGAGWTARLHYLEGQRFELAREAEVKAPSGMAGLSPRRAALAPDQRLALVALAGGDKGSLLVASLETGQAKAVPTELPVDPEAPLLWEGPPRRGKYRFVFTAAGSEGPKPQQGSVALNPGP